MNIISIMRIKKKEQPKYLCKLCETYCISISNMDIHLATNRHKRNEELFKKNEPIRLKNKLTNEFVIHL